MIPSTVIEVSRAKGTYDIEDGDGRLLGQHRTRQGAIDAWRLEHTGANVRIWRRARGAEMGVLIVEGTWHEAKRLDCADHPGSAF